MRILTAKEVGRDLLQDLVLEITCSSSWPQRFSPWRPLWRRKSTILRRNDTQRLSEDAGNGAISWSEYKEVVAVMRSQDNSCISDKELAWMERGRCNATLCAMLGGTPRSKGVFQAKKGRQQLPDKILTQSRNVLMGLSPSFAKAKSTMDRFSRWWRRGWLDDLPEGITKEIITAAPEALPLLEKPPDVWSHRHVPF